MYSNNKCHKFSSKLTHTLYWCVCFQEGGEIICVCFKGFEDEEVDRESG